MYYIEHLLKLLTIEKAKELRFRSGSPPIIVFEREEHFLQGPPISSEDIIRLLRSVAASRNIRDLRDRGTVQFVYALPDRSPFLIRAKMEDDQIVFVIS